MKTYGYDYTFAISVAEVNKILTKNLAGVDVELKYSGTDSESGSTITLDAKMAPFQIIKGGQNQLLRFSMPLTDGYLSIEGPISDSYDLTNVTVLIEVSLGWLGSSNQQSAQSNGDQTKLIFAPTKTGDPKDPGYVAVVKILDPDKHLDTVGMGLLRNYTANILFENKAKLNYLFANVVPQPHNVGSWLKPNKWIYYYVNGQHYDALCFLCLLTDRDFPTTANFDVTALTTTDNSVILVAQEAFFQHAILPSVEKALSKGKFSLSANSEEQAKIKNKGDFSIKTDKGDITAESFVLTESDAGDGLKTETSGGGPLKFFFGLGNLPNASYSWSCDITNKQQYANDLLTFLKDPHPVNHHNQTIHWYDWVILVLVGITSLPGLIAFIVDSINDYSDQLNSVGVGSINDDLQAAVTGAMSNLANLISWDIDGQTFEASQAGLAGALYVNGNLTQSTNHSTTIPMETQTVATAPKLPIPKVVKQLPVNKNADTNDWDTVFAIRFGDANAAIADNWKNVNAKAKNLNQTASDDPSFKIDAQFDPWQLTVGGDGKNIRMKCPLGSGTYHAGSNKYDLTGYGVVVEVGMEWVPNPNQFAFTISDSTAVQAIVKDLNTSTIDNALKTAFTAHSKTLSAAATATLIKQGEEWLITDGANNNYYIFFNQDKFDDDFLHIYQFEDVWKNNLKVLAEEVSQDQPAVVIITVENNKTTGIAAAVLPQLLSEWFNANIGNFNYVFSALDLTPKLSDNTNYGWIKPTGTSYAVTDNGTLENSVFGVLTMTQGHPAPTSHEVSPNAIPEGGKANAGFLISGTSFMRNMMLAGARTIFDDAPETAFDIANDGLTVTNNQELTWGRFKKDDSATATVSNSYASQLDQKQLPADMVNDLFNQGLDVTDFTVHVSTQGVSWWLASQDKKTEYLLDLNGDCIDVYNSIVFTIEKQQFKMSLDNSFLEIQFIDLLYPENWEYDVHINYTEQVAMGLQTIGGKPRFWFNEVTKDMTVNVTKTQVGITVAIVEAAVLAVISLIAVVAPLIDGLQAAASVGEVTEEAGDAAIDAEAFSDAEESLSDSELEENEEEGLNNGADQAGGKWTAFKNAFTATRWKVLGGITAVIGAGVATEQAIEAILQDVSKNNWDKVPAFDEFANTAISPYSWPGVADYNLDSAQLAASLQVGLETVPEQNDQDENTAA